MKTNDTLPDASQIRAEIEQAEALGIHEEPIDLLDPVCEQEALSGHLDDAFEPTVEELTK